MDIEPTNSAEQKLVEKLGKLPLKRVPADLTDQIMTRISLRKQGLINTLWTFISQSHAISFRPIYAFGMALIVCSAFFLGKNFQLAPVQVAQLSAPVPQVQPGMLETPDSAYLVGRGLLRANNGREQALAFLQRASLLEPENPEFAYWEGVGYWANGDKEKERLSYLRGLESNPESVPLLINLGHNYLSDKNYQEALDTYQAVLTLSPDESVARYNSGLIYRALGMIPEEISSWQSFLQNNRTGSKPFRAVERLNSSDDFSFRIYQVGFQKVIINQQALLDDSLPDHMRMEELKIISSILENDDFLNLEIVAFIEDDREAARNKAYEIKNMIVKNSKTDLRNRVKLSWFDVPETIMSDNAEAGVELTEGLLLFGRLRQKQEKEISI